MRHKFSRNYALRVMAFFIAILILVVSATVAQTSKAGLRSARHAVLTDGGENPIIFAPAVGYNSGVYPNSVALGDVNGDGHPDLVLAGTDTSEVSVLLGNGDGTFQAPRTFYSGGYAVMAAVGDVNGDGHPDLVVAIGGGNFVSVLLGNGDGAFQSPVSYGIGAYYPTWVAIGDVNGDGKPDLAVASNCQSFGNCGYGPVSVLLGNGDGTFQAPANYVLGTPQAVVIADVNSDGHPDLVVGELSGGADVLLGNGDGTFQVTARFSSGGGEALSIASGDVNGDGHPDLVVANTSSSVSVLLGNGDGTFQSPVLYSSGGSYATSVAIGDVNGDGYADLAVTNDFTSSVGVLLGNGDGTFQTAVSYSSGGDYSFSAAIGDVNGDGKPDLVVANACTNNCATFGTAGVLLNNLGAPPTTTSLFSNRNPADVGEVLTYTATVTSQSGGTLSGTVTFQDGSTAVATVTLANNQAAYSTSYTRKQIGLHPITATYWGVFRVAEGSQSAALAEYVRDALSKTKVSTSGSPSYIGQPVTFTATVTSKRGLIPDGELVTFYDGTTAIGTGATASGAATFTTSSLTAKTHTIRATYAGDNKFEPSTGLVRQLVQKYPTTTSLSSSLNPSQFGQSVTFTARVTSSGPTPTGKVKFLDGTNSLGSAALSGGSAAITTTKLAVGIHAITAEYLGDADNGKSTSPVLDQVVQ